MRIQVIGDESINRQARTYAEYRLFAALSQVLDLERVQSAVLVIQRVEGDRDCQGVHCFVTVETEGGELLKARTSGAHPYAAINRLVERIRERGWPAHIVRQRVERAVSD